MDRLGTSEQRKLVLQNINERQILSQNQVLPPLVIFPEGCTTNMRYLIEFKKGAFKGLNSIQPIALQYSSVFSCPSHSIMNYFDACFLLMGNPYVTLHAKEYPVFQPNEYFFAHHWT
jgi:hypothetical protein